MRLQTAGEGRNDTSIIPGAADAHLGTDGRLQLTWHHAGRTLLVELSPADVGAVRAVLDDAEADIHIDEHGDPGPVPTVHAIAVTNYGQWYADQHRERAAEALSKRDALKRGVHDDLRDELLAEAQVHATMAAAKR